MPIAKEPLLIGRIVVARVGHYVNANTVERYGWQDKVEPDDPNRYSFVDPVITVRLPVEDQPPAPPPKGRRRKGGR